jgi:hypothetical protein
MFSSNNQRVGDNLGMDGIQKDGKEKPHMMKNHQLVAKFARFRRGCHEGVDKAVQ